MNHYPFSTSILLSLFPMSSANVSSKVSEESKRILEQKEMDLLLTHLLVIID